MTDNRTVSIDQVNRAFQYMLEIEVRPKKRSEFLCLGRNHQTREFINEKLKHRLPPIPLLADNKILRDNLKAREKSPLFRIVASQLAFKFQDLKQQIKDARKFDPPKYPVLYRLEPAIDGEIPNEPLTWEDYQVFCDNETPKVSR